MVAVKPLKDTEIFKPTKVGNHELSNKIVYAPTTRMRAIADHTPSDLAYKYYDDRTKYPGSLVITEATLMSPKTGLYDRVPGIYTDEHVAGWKKITDKIHANGSKVSMQLWPLGRVADPVATKKAGYPLVAPSLIYPSEEAKKAAEEAGNPIHVLTTEEVEDLVNDFVHAAKKAVAAGVDYVEVHGAHGYLVDTFFQVSTNKRTDKYGGSIENRARFALEILDRLIEEIGAERVAIRISPWAKFQGILAEEGEVNPVAQFGYFLSELENRARAGKRIAYVSIVEPRVSGVIDVAGEDIQGDNSFVRSVWKGIVIKAGNYTYDAPEFKTLLQDVSDGKTLVAFARYFTSNPDLVQRLHDGADLTPYKRELFYAPSNWGYNTFTNAGETKTFSEEEESKRLPAPIDTKA
ncbi:NADH:flavin oxidoreductase / NADH oxidase family protein [Clavispora lusitaniae]|uniref:Probable NADPH dehydrogenase n=1 Tax=Clavispora lusitaniae (strain ATCC 42720) TaxID=306902 RepID=C4Y835_CLAL4|nr:uncharacterized protein CLUG_04363 [Clavispora lusitaniae ATCC 42720]EEQ40235.1 hypothetical protein CLUG_04363 [Clavispora lusitaniae ATCC 42720]KAF5209781.1 hypothetical protein E0198_004093 [Clavispora lusitaniae]KAF7581822.1 NADH:flavin oxidoreductase / NADH oxidase family protein [Clavispora lusitaniae]